MVKFCNNFFVLFYIYREILEKSSIQINVILSYCRYSLWDNELINYLDYFKVMYLNFYHFSSTFFAPKKSHKFSFENLFFCYSFQSKNIGIINAAIFGMGLLANDNSTEIPKWHPASEKIKNRCQLARKICMVSLFRVCFFHY